MVDREGIDGLIRERSLDVRFWMSRLGFCAEQNPGFWNILYYIQIYIYIHIYIIYIYIPFGVEVLIYIYIYIYDGLKATYGNFPCQSDVQNLGKILFARLEQNFRKLGFLSNEKNPVVV